MSLLQHQTAETTDPTLKALSALPTATLHEVMGRKGDLPSALKPLSKTMKFCGPAFTVNTPARSNLLIHKALYAASAGDILLVSTDGFYDAGYWGEIMNTAAIVQKLGGLVIDAGVRDSDFLEQQGFPVFSRTISYRGTEKYPGGSLNEPMNFYGTIVKPGDYLVGDRDGVVVVPKADCGAIIQAAIAREDKESTILERIIAGESTLDIYNFH